jgi:biopolymer transport protein ExbB
MHIFFLQATAPKTESFMEIAMKGGYVMIPILLLFVLALFLFVERLLYYFKMSRMNKHMMPHIKEQLIKGDLNAAIQHCDTQDGAFPIVVHTGLKSMSAGGNLKDVEESMESVANILFTRISNPLSILGLIAGIAPMLGFLGTILGIIKIFSEIAAQDNIIIGTIAGGLYIKMVTSFAGLLVGMLAYIAYHFLQFLVERFALKVETEIFEFMTFLKQPQQVKKSA